MFARSWLITFVPLISLQFELHGARVQLIRVRNPWGNEQEWKGAWADG